MSLYPLRQAYSVRRGFDAACSIDILGVDVVHASGIDDSKYRLLY
jgi:hypothetical protein